MRYLLLSMFYHKYSNIAYHFINTDQFSMFSNLVNDFHEIIRQTFQYIIIRSYFTLFFLGKEKNTAKYSYYFQYIRHVRNNVERRCIIKLKYPEGIWRIACFFEEDALENNVLWIFYKRTI